MKPILAFALLILFPLVFNAQITQPVWELHEVGSNGNWVYNKYYTYQYSPAGQLQRLDSYLTYNQVTQQWSNKTTKIYNLNSCDSTLSIYGYNASNTLNDSMRYVRIDNCNRVDSVYFYYLANTPGAPTGMISKSKRTYDANGRLINIQGYGFSPNSGWYNSANKSWGYNADGNILSYTNYNGNPYPGGYNSTTTNYYYNSTIGPYLSVKNYENLNVTYWNNQPEYDYYENKVDSSLYYYTPLGLRDSINVYYPIYVQDSLGEQQFLSWKLVNRRFYSYNANQKTDTILNLRPNGAMWESDSLTTYEYIGDWLFRKSTYRWYNDEWNKVLRISYGNPTGIEEDDTSVGISLFPNPATDNTIITFAEIPQQSYTIQLYSIDGKLLSSTQTKDKQYVLNLDGITNGLYLIRVTQNGHSTTQKLCIAR